MAEKKEIVYSRGAFEETENTLWSLRRRLESLPTRARLDELITERTVIEEKEADLKAEEKRLLKAAHKEALTTNEKWNRVHFRRTKAEASLEKTEGAVVGLRRELGMPKEPWSKTGGEWRAFMERFYEEKMGLRVLIFLR